MSKKRRTKELYSYSQKSFPPQNQCNTTYAASNCTSCTLSGCSWCVNPSYSSTQTNQPSGYTIPPFCYNGDSYKSTVSNNNNPNAPKDIFCDRIDVDASMCGVSNRLPLAVYIFIVLIQILFPLCCICACISSVCFIFNRMRKMREQRIVPYSADSHHSQPQQIYQPQSQSQPIVVPVMAHAIYLNDPQPQPHQEVFLHGNQQTLQYPPDSTNLHTADVDQGYFVNDLSHGQEFGGYEVHAYPVHTTRPKPF